MQAWNDFLEKQKKIINPESLEKWLSGIHLKTFDACNLFLEFKDNFHKEWFMQHLFDAAKKLTNNNGRPIKIHFASTPVIKKKIAPSFFKKEQPKHHIKPSPLNPFCTFDYFAAGDSNEVPFKFLIETTGYQSDTIPPVAFNPIYIYGPSGVGKTHLLMSAASAYKKAGVSVFYVDAMDFAD
ncbi:MAG TPA: DnaA/Hda family protein, partial [Chlamydiales bacterium]|nr:DnaA/Hda family protein [Chlamydiales bacterium]